MGVWCVDKPWVTCIVRGMMSMHIHACEWWSIVWTQENKCGDISYSESSGQCYRNINISSNNSFHDINNVGNNRGKHDGINIKTCSG